MNRILPLILVLFVSFTPLTFAQTEEDVVVPNSLTNVEGNTQNNLPINCGQFGNTSTRYQQAYLSSQINGLPVEIKGINFRLSEDRVEVPPVEIPNIQINMSTTQAQPGNLSATFADNLGLIVTPVYSGPLTISSPACGTGPCPFTIPIPLQTPYMYDPDDGNLIIDIRISSCMGIINIQMDASNTSENLDITSRVCTGNPGMLGENSPVGDLVNDTGLVTEFELTVLPPTKNVPTLSEWGLIATAAFLGIIGFMVIRRRQLTA